MKNYRLISFVFIIFLAGIGILFCRDQVKAADTFELLNFSTSTTAVVYTPFVKTIRFIYSGNYLPSVSFLEKNIPDNLKVGSLLCGGNGQCSFVFQGTPETVGDYQLTILLTDNNGAILTQPFEFKVINRQLSLSAYSLPDGVAGKPYFATIKISYVGQITTNVRHDIPFDSGLEINSIAQPNSSEYPSGQYLITIKGTSKNPANYKIEVIVASVGTLPQGIFPYKLTINSGPKIAIDISQLKVKVFTDKTKKKLVNISNSNFYNQPLFSFSDLKNKTIYYIYFGINGQADPVKNGVLLAGNEFRPKPIIKAGVYYLIIKARSTTGDVSKPIIIKYKYKVA